MATATATERTDIEDICDLAFGETEVDAFGLTFGVLAAISNDDIPSLSSCQLHGFIIE